MRAFFAASILVPPDGSASFIDPEESSISRTLGAGSSACAAGRTGPHTDTSSKAPQAAARRWDRFIGLPPIFATANLRFAVANVKPWADTLRPTFTNPDPTIRPDHHPHPRGNSSPPRLCETRTPDAHHPPTSQQPRTFFQGISGKRTKLLSPEKASDFRRRH